MGFLSPIATQPSGGLLLKQCGALGCLFSNYNTFEKYGKVFTVGICAMCSRNQTTFHDTTSASTSRLPESLRD